MVSHERLHCTLCVTQAGQRHLLSSGHRVTEPHAMMNLHVLHITTQFTGSSVLVRTDFKKSQFSCKHKRNTKNMLTACSH